ncbi:unnamed protein product [Dicrocoelium dendriticum]|nr:unnamed protein product [Dicrocoelium dendriticum]
MPFRFQDTWPTQLRSLGLVRRCTTTMLLSDALQKPPKSGFPLFISRACSFLRIIFHIGYIPFVIYLGITNQGHPLESPISLWNVIMPLSMAPQ